MTTYKRNGDWDATSAAGEDAFGLGMRVIGNLTYAALTLRDCSFAGAYTITCSSLTIDESSWQAAKVAGVTFTVSGTTTYLWRGQVLNWGALSCTTAQFVPFGTRSTGSTTDATEFHAQFYVPRACRLVNFRAYMSTSGTVTVRKNGVDTALTLAPTGAFLQDSTHAVDCATGDGISLGLSGTVVGTCAAAVEML
jgi:hypothetical protein